VGAVFYWSWTEQHGVGDLRPYALVQFLPLLLIALMLWLYPGSRDSTAWLWWSFLMYGLAKVAEYFDAPIYRLLDFSGHTIKHLLSAAAVLCALLALLHLGGTQNIREARLSGPRQGSQDRTKVRYKPGKGPR
jgi:hypothetical protein